MRLILPATAAVLGLSAGAAEASRANPIRKVVNLLQGLRKEVESEGEADKKAFDKAMCFCTTNDAKSAQEIDDSTARISSLTATIKELEGSNAQLKSEIKDLSEEIAEDQKSVDEATKVRSEEAGQYTSEAMELKTNIAALQSAIPALKKGMSFIQGDGAFPTSFLQKVRGPLAKVASSAQSGDRDMIMSFLQGKAQSGGADQILGILETMLDNFKENLANATKAEEDALTEYNNLMGGKNAELKAARAEAEEKKGRVAGQVQKKADSEEDLEDTQQTLDAATTYLTNLRKQCTDKRKEFETNEQLRAEETMAIQDTIKILNDDDALDMFKKTLPSPEEAAAAFVQVQKKSIKAISFVQTAAQSGAKFDKLKAMVQNMVAVMVEDQSEDDKQLKWCRGETDTVNNQLSSTKEEVKTYKQKLEETKNEVKVVADEIAVLVGEIKDLDKAVAEATANRQAEQAAFVQTMSELNIASTLLQKASERLAAQYAPKQAEDGDDAALIQHSSDSETSDMLGLSFVQLRSDAPRSAPNTGAGMSIIAMITKLRTDISRQQAEKKRDSVEQTKDYEEFVRDSQQSRQVKKEDVTNKSAAKGRAEEVLNAVKKKKTEALTEQGTILNKVEAIHSNCNFIMENHQARREARANEVEGLKKSLAVLSGAQGTDYGAATTTPAPTAMAPGLAPEFVQTSAFLARRA